MNPQKARKKHNNRQRLEISRLYGLEINVMTADDG
jgi:hypothetical protein